MSVPFTIPTHKSYHLQAPFEFFSPFPRLTVVPYQQRSSSFSAASDSKYTIRSTFGSCLAPYSASYLNGLSLPSKRSEIMSPRTPGKASRPGAARRRRGRRKLTPRSPLSLLAQTRKNSVVKKRDRGDVVSSTKTKLTERRSKPGRSSRLNLLPLSTEPREKVSDDKNRESCFEFLFCP